MNTQEVQLRLINHGYYPGRVDGKHGTKTAAAIKALQTDRGIKATGTLDNATIIALGTTFPKMRITADALRRMGVADDLASSKAAQYDPLFRNHGITTVLRMAHFLGQVMHESRKFEAVEENLYYTTAERIRQVWPTRFPTIESAQPYTRNPKMLANKVYGGRMGNHNPGDGWKNRGRGDIHTTGANNYRGLFQWLGLPLDTDPNLVATKYAAASAIRYWTVNGLNTYAASDQYETLTRRINGGTHGIYDRIALTERAKEVLCEAMRNQQQKPEPKNPHIKPIPVKPLDDLTVEEYNHTSRFTFGKPRR